MPVPDILSQGREREPGSGQPGRTGHGPGAAWRWPESPLPCWPRSWSAGSPGIMPRPTIPRIQPARRWLAQGPGQMPTCLPSRAGLTGPTAAWDASLRLPLAGSQPAWFYPSSGAASRSAACRPARSGTRSPAPWAAGRCRRPRPPGRTASWAARPVPARRCRSGSWPTARRGPPGRAARTWSRRAPRRGTLWLTSYPPGAAAAPGTAQLTAADGRALGPPVRLPDGYVIEAGTVRGLLLAPRRRPAGRHRPAARGPAVEPGDRPGHPAAVRCDRGQRGPGRLAGAVPGRVPAHLLELASGWMTTIPLAPGSTVPAAAFSPDGRFLALQVTSPAGGDSGAAPTRLEVAGLIRAAAQPGAGHLGQQRRAGRVRLARRPGPPGRRAELHHQSAGRGVEAGCPAAGRSPVRPGPHLGSVVTG